MQAEMIQPEFRCNIKIWYMTIAADKAYWKQINLIYAPHATALSLSHRNVKVIESKVHATLLFR
ncbi:hypothetical protein BXP70_25590 [Hymenobacter crusticola]|uniref:Uncharacterized protein n=1 Tax=Hymenobacter crusticola TaxID=1770526 RepID=A0A243W6U7_9BACT|nr:hypothetical protein BXP70_25590 [Hymenobacter crusticola]